MVALFLLVDSSSWLNLLCCWVGGSALLLVGICLLGSDVVGSLLISSAVELVMSFLGAGLVFFFMGLIVGAGSVLCFVDVDVGVLC